ncbi:hypothetical protein L1887_23891 [Cichorium endivia]|nr:hypothetical protein L1887_23891 [Cichorium endivia]
MIEVDAINVIENCPSAQSAVDKFNNFESALSSMVSLHVSSSFELVDLQSIYYKFNVCAHQISFLPYQLTQQDLTNELYFNLHCINNDHFHLFLIQFHLQEAGNLLEKKMPSTQEKAIMGSVKEEGNGDSSLKGQNKEDTIGE